MYCETKSALKNKNPGIEGGCEYLKTVKRKGSEKELPEFHVSDWRLRGMNSQQRRKGRKSSKGRYRMWRVVMELDEEQLSGLSSYWRTVCESRETGGKGATCGGDREDSRISYRLKAKNSHLLTLVFSVETNWLAERGRLMVAKE